MKTSIFIAAVALLFSSCEKGEEIHSSPFDKIESGTWHIANADTIPCRYVVAIDPVENVQPYEIIVTSDTIIKIYERESYKVFYKDEFGNDQVIEHQVLTGLHSYIDSLPCTIWQ